MSKDCGSIALFLAYPQAELRALVDDQMREELHKSNCWAVPKSELTHALYATWWYLVDVLVKGSLKELPCYGYLWWPRMNGMEWNGLEWNGMDWNGLEWNWMEYWIGWNIELNGMGLEWNGIGMEWNGLDWLGMDWNGMEIEWNVELNWMEWDGMEWLGMEWIGLEWIGMDWNDMAWHETFQFQILKEVSHESFSSTSAAFRFWGKSRTKASISHLPLSDFEGGLARKLRFRIFRFHFWREVSHESFFFTSYTVTLWGKSRTKCLFER